MKAKLIKEKDWYDLYRIDEDGKRVTFASTQDYKQKLSIKNCQAIERGYDLDELAETFAKTHSLYPTSQDDTEYGFKAGFQKALEILGDRRFTEEDMVSAIIQARDVNELADVIHKRFRKGIDEIIDSLQQNEWDVEVEMTLAKEYYGYVKKLDADGCLILKRV